MLSLTRFQTRTRLKKLYRCSCLVADSGNFSLESSSIFLPRYIIVEPSHFFHQSRSSSSPRRKKKRKEFEAMAEDFFSDPWRRVFFGRPILRQLYGSSRAPMDWLETPSAHIIRVSVPGLGRDEVKVQLEEGNLLLIQGKEKREEDHVKEAVWHVMERGKAEFDRRIALPDNVKADQIKAHVEKGVLTVVVPKEPEPTKPQPRNIQVSSRL